MISAGTDGQSHSHAGRGDSSRRPHPFPFRLALSHPIGRRVRRETLRLRAHRRR